MSPLPPLPEDGPPLSEPLPDELALDEPPPEELAPDEPSPGELDPDELPPGELPLEELPIGKLELGSGLLFPHATARQSQAAAAHAWNPRLEIPLEMCDIMRDPGFCLRVVRSGRVSAASVPAAVLAARVQGPRKHGHFALRVSPRRSLPAEAEHRPDVCHGRSSRSCCLRRSAMVRQRRKSLSGSHGGPRRLTSQDGSALGVPVSHIHFIGGEKGGVGKSLVARVLSQWFIDRSEPFAALDADTSHRTLLRSYGSYSQPVDLDNFLSADEIANRALAADRSVVVDLPAQSSRALERWMQSVDLVRFCRDAGIRLTLWHVTDGTFDSVRDLERSLEVWAESFSFVLAKNHGRCKDFSLFDESDARRRLEVLGGRIVDVPELDAAAMARIDRTCVSLWAAVNGAEGNLALAPMQRQRTRLWLDRCYQSLGAAAGSG